MEFKITMPETQIKNEEIENMIKAMFNEDLTNDGILAKVFVFCYLKQPIRVTELTEKLNEYYKTDIDRSAIARALNKLVLKHVVCVKGSLDSLSNNPGEQTEMDKRIIERYHVFINHIPAPFRKNYNDVNYYWIANGEGIKYLEWCCKLLKFECEKQ